MSSFDFNPYEAAPAVSQSYELIPNGVYNVVISKSEMGTTQKGDAKLSLTMDICEGSHPEFANRKVFENLNIGNSNPKAREISREQLSAICSIMGEGTVEGPDDLVGGEIAVRIGTQEARGEYAARNVVKGYLKRKDEASAPAASATEAAPAKKAWAR